MFSPSRDDARRFFFNTWSKQQNGQPLTELERITLAVLLAHPEYQPILDQPERYLNREWTPEEGQTNPFLHLGLHLALEEQRSIDQPPGIRALYARLAAHATDEHQAQHQCIDALAETIWQAQRQGCPPDGDSYLQALRRLAGDTGTK